MSDILPLSLFLENVDVSSTVGLYVGVPVATNGSAAEASWDIGWLEDEADLEASRPLA